MKEEKQVLTHAEIAKKLIWNAKSSIVTSVFIFFMVCLIAMPNLLIADSVEEYIIFWSLTVIFTSIPVVSFVRAAIRRSWAKKGDFSVISDRLEYVDDYRPNLLYMIIHAKSLDVLIHRERYCYHRFRFESGIEHVVDAGRTFTDVAAEFSDAGDSFFIVVYNKAPQKIMLFYNSKMYDYKV